MNGETMLLIFFGIVVILLLSIIMITLIKNQRTIKMLSEEIIGFLTPTPLENREELNIAVDQSITDALSGGSELGRLLVKTAVSNGAAQEHNDIALQIRNINPDDDTPSSST